MIEPRTLRRNLRELPPAAWALCAGTFINRFGSFAIAFLILYLTRRGFSVQQAGAAVSLYGLGGLGASLAGGDLADRIGRTRTIALSMFGSAGAMLALSQANQLPLILLLTTVAGLMSEAYRPASTALLGDLVPSGHRVAAFGALRLALNGGVALGAATAGLLAQRSFLLVFLLDAATSLIFGLLATVVIREVNITRQVMADNRATGYRAVLADRVFLVFLGSTLLIAFVYLQSFTTLSLQVRALGFSNAVYGGLIALNGLLIVFLELPLISLTQYRRPRPAIALGFLLVALGFSTVATAHAVPLLVMAVVIWTFGEMISSPVANAYIADLAPATLRGRYQGAFGLTWGVAWTLGPIVGASLFAWNGRAFWLLCGALAGAASALVLWSSRLPPTGARMAVRSE